MVLTARGCWNCCFSLGWMISVFLSSSWLAAVINRRGFGGNRKSRLLAVVTRRVAVTAGGCLISCPSSSAGCTTSVFLSWSAAVAWWWGHGYAWNGSGWADSMDVGLSGEGRIQSTIILDRDISCLPYLHPLTSTFLMMIGVTMRTASIMTFTFADTRQHWELSASSLSFYWRKRKSGKT